MIKLSNAQIAIFGRPNFACMQAAKILIAAGIYADEKKSAEYEQAVFIHWASSLLAEHGEKWYVAADKIISDLLRAQRAAKQKEGE